tara:strand:- start:245 stop:709 length:465 start_codon:yes stop_codon:yes gene_type:complete
MSDSARLAVDEDLSSFMHLHSLSRLGIEGHKGSDLWIERKSLNSKSEDLFTQLLSNERYGCILGLYENCPFGFLIAELTELYGKTSVDIHEVFVEADARKVGIGESMMECLIEWAKERSAKSITSRALPGDRELKNYFERYKLTARLIEVERIL